MISDPDLAQRMSKGLIYYIDEVRPLIQEREFYRERGRLGIHARVFSLSGIERVCALITSSAQGPSVAQGGPLTDEPVICLEPEDPNPYGGSYFIEIDDPYPRVYCILKDKNLKDQDIYYVKTRECQYADRIDDNPASFDIRHIPSHYIYPQDHSWNFNTIRERLAYSLGDPALMGADPSLIRSTQVLEGDETITLILTVNEFADIDANTPSAELHTTSGEIYTIPLYQTEDLTDIHKWEHTIDKDRTCSRVIFHVQQVQDANQPGIIDWREYSLIASPGDTHIDPNGRDYFEPDDTPGDAKPIWVQVIDDPRYHQQHTFHNPNDAD